MARFRAIRAGWPRRVIAALIAAPLLCAAPVASAEPGRSVPGRLAFVERDASLRLGRTIVRLHAIHIPQTKRFCRTFLRPVRCGSRAVLALERIIHGLVYCDYVSRNRDRSVNAVCSVNADGPSPRARVDLSAFLLRQGWAVALPGAPIAYRTLERIAQLKRRGIWGFQADSVRFR